MTLLDPRPGLLPILEVEKANLGVEEDGTREPRHLGFPGSIADNGATFDPPSMQDVKLDLVPQGSQFDAVKIGHLDQAPHAPVLLYQLFKLRYELLIIRMQELAAELDADDLSSTPLQNLYHCITLRLPAMRCMREMIGQTSRRA
jgi:hypothetical protein